MKSIIASLLGSPKTRSFVSFLLVVTGLIIGVWLYNFSPYVGVGYIVFSLVAGIAIAVRTRCPHCATSLALERPYMAGALIFLWAVREKCPRCGADLFKKS